MTQYSSPLPASWVEVPLNTLLVKLSNGKILHQGWSPQCEKDASVDSDVWGVLKTTAIQNGAFHPEHNKRLPSNLAPRDELEVQEGDILLTCAGPRSRCGIPCYVRSTRPKLILSGKMYRFRVRPGIIEPRYLEVFLQSPQVQSKIDTMKTGISDSGLNLTHNRFSQLPVRVPPYDEQIRIADRLDELFTDLSAGVAALERVKRKLARYRAAVLHAAVTGRLTEDWRKKHGSAEESGAKLLERILIERRRQWEQRTLQQYEQKGKKLPKNWRDNYKLPQRGDCQENAIIPNDWTMITLDSLTTTASNGFVKRSQKLGIPSIVLRLADIQNGQIELTNTRRINATADEVRLYTLNENDILIVRVNGSADLVGRFIIADLFEEPILYCDHFIRVRLTFPATAPFLRFFSETHVARSYIDNNKVSSAGQNTVNQNCILNLSIPFPPMNEQMEIIKIAHEKLSLISALEVEIEHGLAKASRLRQTLLKSAFDGKLLPRKAVV